MNVYIETYGCSANISDSEIIAGLLNGAGFEIVNNIDLADIIILNTCVVKGTTERKVLHRIKKISESYPGKLIVTGCMPETEMDKIKDIVDCPTLGTNVTDIVKLVRNYLNGKNLDIIGEKSDKVCQPKISKNKIIDIIQISEGCLCNCSFCLTKKARGDLRSFDPEKIVKEIKQTHSSGVKEYWLTSQDCGCYGIDIKSSLPELIDKITTEVSGFYKIRIGMTNPQYINDSWIDMFKNSKVFKFLHIPVQSGSNKVLKDMRRGHTVEDYKRVVEKFRKHIPDITIWTDIIVGYPTETEQDFSKTLELIQETKPDYVNISRYAPRPMTEGKKLKQLPTEIKKKRSKELTEIVRKCSLDNNKKWIGKETEVLVDEYNHEHRNFLGRTDSYKLVSLENVRIGERLKVKIKDAKETHLIG